MYSKLIGGEHVGLYTSLLEMSKTIARAVAGYMIGAAYGSMGSCALWLLTLAIWVLQFVPFMACWSKLETQDMAEALIVDEEVACVRSAIDS